MRLFTQRAGTDKRLSTNTAGTSAEHSAIGLLLQSPYSTASCARFREGPSLDIETMFIIHEDASHVDRLPVQVPIAIRACLFVRHGVGAIVVMLEIGDDVYETWWNFHNPALRPSFYDICDQEKLLVSFYVDRSTPARTLWVPNTLRARFRGVVAALEEMEPWEMAAFDQVRQEVYSEYPTVQALWASMEDVSGGPGLASPQTAYK